MNPITTFILGFILGVLSLAGFELFLAGYLKPEAEVDLIEPEDLKDEPNGK